MSSGQLIRASRAKVTSADVSTISNHDKPVHFTRGASKLSYTFAKHNNTKTTEKNTMESNGDDNVFKSIPRNLSTKTSAFETIPSHHWERKKFGPKNSYYQCGKAVWDSAERSILEEGLELYPSNIHSNMTIYVKIAAMLPQKMVRDVAFAVWELHETRCETLYRRNQTNMGGQKRQRVAIRVPDIVHQGLDKEKKARPRDPVNIRPATEPHLNDRNMENRIHQLMQENVNVIANLRENLLMGRLVENYAYMHQFDRNVSETLSMLNSLPLRMPPLAVKVNTILISGHHRGSLDSGSENGTLLEDSSTNTKSSDSLPMIDEGTKSSALH